MRKKNVTAWYIVFVFTAIVAAFGCEELTGKISSDQLPSIPAECTGSSNYHKKVLDAIYRMGQASKMQLRRAEDQFYTCLKNEGFSSEEALGIIKKQDEDYRENVEKDGVKNGSDMLLF